MSDHPDIGDEFDNRQAMTATIPASPELTDEQLNNLESHARQGDITGANALALIAELRRHRSSPSSAWRDIKDAPKDGSFVDLWSLREHRRIPDCRWYVNSAGFEGWHAQQGGRAWNMGTDENFSHYRDLPEPPK